MEHDQAKPLAGRYRLNRAWINCFRLHMVPLDLQRGLDRPVALAARLAVVAALQPGVGSRYVGRCGRQSLPSSL